MQIDSDKLRRLVQDRGLTQTALAGLAQLSRARMAAILSQRSANVHASTERKIAAALGLPPGALDLHGVESAYREHVARRHESLDFAGLAVICPGQPMPMDSGFAILHVTERRRQGMHHVDGDGCGAIRSPALQRFPSIPLASSLTHSRRVFLLGDPGTGKTTALRHMARAYALGKHRERGYPSKNFTPVFVGLAEWAEQLRDNQACDVLDAAMARVSVHDPAATTDWLRQQARRGKLLLLLDGLDEVADPDLKATVIEKVRCFVQANRRIRVVMTARQVGFEKPNLGAPFKAFVLDPLTDATIRVFAKQWCAFRHGHPVSRECRECDRRLEGLRHAILDHPQVKALAANPMMLTILLLLHEAGAALPRRRCELYQRICEAFLFSWQEKKRSAGFGAPDQGLELEDREILWILESLALKMQERDWTLVPRWWLTEHINSFLRDELGHAPDAARRAAEAVLWTLEERAGLLAERGPERYGFRHLALQEYLAARAVLATDDPIGFLRRYLYHPRWREVVRLVAAQLDRRRVPDLLRAILDDPDPTGRFLRRGLLLALSCLADGAPVHNSELLTVIMAGCEELGGTRWLGLALEARNLLAELFPTRHGALARRAWEKMLGRAKAESGFLAACWELVNRLSQGVEDEAGHVQPGATAVAPPDNRTSVALAEITIDVADGVSIAFVRAETPEQFGRGWTDAVLEQLGSDASPAVRSACADALARFAGQWEKVGAALSGALRNDEEPSVRAACARALGSAAAHERGVRQLMLDTLQSKQPEQVRAGAGRGLSHCVQDDTEVRDLLEHTMHDSDEDDEVRAACLLSLEGILPSRIGMLDSVGAFLSLPSGSRASGAAARVLAKVAALGTVDWSRLPIERIEQVLVSLEAPDPEALDALRGLVDAREVRRLGVAREERIRRALVEAESRIRTMFIFGSSARGDQGPESDIDLMVIGDVSLRDLTPGLKRAEQELGRQVNVVIYSEQDWAERCRDRNYFVMEVLRQKKVFITGEAHELAAMAGQLLDHQN